MPEPSEPTIDGQPWEEARGPHLPDRLTALPWQTIVFALFALGMAIVVMTRVLAPPVDAYSVVREVVGGIPTVVAFLLPAALFLRHRDAWQAYRILVAGTVLFAAVEILQFIQPGLSGWFDSIIPAPPDLPFAAPLDTAYSSVVGLLSALAPFLVARGLDAARQYEDATGARRWWLVVAAVTLITGVTIVLRLVNVSLDIPPDAVAAYYWLAVLSVVISLVLLFAWASMAGIALVGWRSLEDPRRGWGLAALAGLLVLLGFAINGLLGAVTFFGNVALPNELSIGISAAFALGYLALLGAFLVGLPADREV